MTKKKKKVTIKVLSSVDEELVRYCEDHTSEEDFLFRTRDINRIYELADLPDRVTGKGFHKMTETMPGLCQMIRLKYVSPTSPEAQREFALEQLNEVSFLDQVAGLIHGLFVEWAKNAALEKLKEESELKTLLTAYSRLPAAEKEVRKTWAHQVLDTIKEKIIK